jgi:hypothetical protein
VSSLSFRLFAFGRGTGRRSFFCGLCQFFHDRLTLRRVELIQLTFQHFGNLNRSFLTGFFNGCIQELTIRSRITSGKSMTSATAQKLLGSGKVKLKNCKSERTGNTFDATVFMEVSDDGKTKFSMEFENGGKRK